MSGGVEAVEPGRGHAADDVRRSPGAIPETDGRHFGVVEERAHDRYPRLARLVRERDRDLSAVFDGHSRSRARLQLVHLVRLGLVTEDDVAEFGDATRVTLRHIGDASNGLPTE